MQNTKKNCVCDKECILCLTSNTSQKDINFHEVVINIFNRTTRKISKCEISQKTTEKLTNKCLHDLC